MRGLRRLGPRSLVVTLECAGNGRRSMTPTPPGVAWPYGAAGTARFTGVPLAAVLERARPRRGVREVLFTSADRGPVKTGEVIAFARSLPLDVAAHRIRLTIRSPSARATARRNGGGTRRP